MIEIDPYPYLQLIRIEGQLKRYKTSSEQAEREAGELKTQNRTMKKEVGAVYGGTHYGVVLSCAMSRMHSTRRKRQISICKVDSRSCDRHVKASFNAHTAVRLVLSRAGAAFTKNVWAYVHVSKTIIECYYRRFPFFFLSFSRILNVFFTNRHLCRNTTIYFDDDIVLLFINR